MFKIRSEITIILLVTGIILTVGFVAPVAAQSDGDTTDGLAVDVDVNDGETITLEEDSVASLYLEFDDIDDWEFENPDPEDAFVVDEDDNVAGWLFGAGEQDVVVNVDLTPAGVEVGYTETVDVISGGETIDTIEVEVVGEESDVEEIDIEEGGTIDIAEEDVGSVLFQFDDIDNWEFENQDPADGWVVDDGDDAAGWLFGGNPQDVDVRVDFVPVGLEVGHTETVDVVSGGETIDTLELEVVDDPDDFTGEITDRIDNDEAINSMVESTSAETTEDLNSILVVDEAVGAYTSEPDDVEYGILDVDNLIGAYTEH